MIRRIMVESCNLELLDTVPYPGRAGTNTATYNYRKLCAAACEPVCGSDPARDTHPKATIQRASQL